LHHVVRIAAFLALVVGIAAIVLAVHAATGGEAPMLLVHVTVLGFFAMAGAAILVASFTFRSDFPLNRGDTIPRMLKSGPRWAVPLVVKLGAVAVGLAVWFSGGKCHHDVIVWSEATGTERALLFCIMSPFWFLQFLLLLASADRLRDGPHR
jgi:hypothetical protein